MATKAGELRDKTDAQLRDELRSIQRALFGLRVELANQATENTASLGKLRREIACVKTVLRERRIAQSAPETSR